MFVKFNKIIFKNIFAFGKVPTEFNFSKGLSLIIGENGCGKSTILDSIAYCLFGKPYRKININELLNRKNKKDLYVECHFEIGSDKYIISRGMKPKVLKIIKNKKELNLLPSATLNQIEIDKILGINYQMFKNIISLAVNYNKPFLALEASEKRNVIEYIFNIRVFGDMLKLVKKDNSELNIQNKIQTKSIEFLEENIKSIRRKQQEFVKIISDFEKDKQISIDKTILEEKSLQTQIEQLKQDIKQTQIEIDKKEKAVKELPYLEKQNNDLATRLIFIKTAVTNNNNTLKTIKNNDICTVCNNKITEEHVKIEEERISKENIKFKEEFELTTQKNKQVIQDRNILEQEKSKIYALKNNIDRFENNIGMFTKQIKGLQNDRLEFENKTLDVDIDSVNEELKTKAKEYTKEYKIFKNITTNIENNKIISDILSDSGIKAFFFKKLTPILNEKINDYIKMFSLPFSLTFDDMMKEQICDLRNRNMEVSYYSCSEGEKKRIDLAILFSFIDITKLICNWNCNLLMIDELLDGAIDEPGLKKVIFSLKKSAYDNDLCTYIISHKIQDKFYQYFDSFVNVKKQSSGFSEINI